MMVMDNAYYNKNLCIVLSLLCTYFFCIFRCSFWYASVLFSNNLQQYYNIQVPIQFAVKSSSLNNISKWSRCTLIGSILIRNITHNCYHNKKIQLPQKENRHLNKKNIMKINVCQPEFHHIHIKNCRNSN